MSNFIGRVPRSRCKRCGSTTFAYRYATYCGPVCAQAARREYYQAKAMRRPPGRRPSRLTQKVRQREKLLEGAAYEAKILGITKREVLISWKADPGMVRT